MLGLSDAWSGVINDTASTSTLVALLCARERASKYSLARGGLQAEAQPLVVYASAHSHSSVEKAALLAGFGKSNVRDRAARRRARHACRIARAAWSQDDIAERPQAVRGRRDDRHHDVHRARSARRRSRAVAKANGMWLHVDAAMAGSAMILPECRWMWQGVERADSLIVNAHKWLGAVFDCTIYFVRDPEHLVRVMSTNPSYLQTAADGRVKNYRDWGLPLGRRFRALEAVVPDPRAGRRRACRRGCAATSTTRNGSRSRSRRRRTGGCWRRCRCRRCACVTSRAGFSGEALDRHTLDWAARLNQSGEAYLTPAMLDGRWMVRVSIGAELTEREHVAATLAADAARLLLESAAPGQSAGCAARSAVPSGCSRA